MMKRILLVLLALSLAVSMSACGLTETIKTGITVGVENAQVHLGDAVHFAPGATLLREETDDVITDADGNQTLTHTVTRYEYDANDNQTLMETTVTDENGAVSVSRVESKYDAQGQPIETKSVN